MTKLQFHYWPLVWMFCLKQPNNSIRKCKKRALTLYVPTPQNGQTHSNNFKGLRILND